MASHLVLAGSKARVVLLSTFAVLALHSGLFAQCTLNPQNQTVTICSPSNGATVSSPVNIVAGTTDSNPVTLMQVYIDGVKKYEVKAGQLSTSQAIAAGTHRITVQAQDTTKAWFKQTINITVGGGSTGLSKLKHIIFLMQENRSADNYFGKLGQYRAQFGYPGTFDGIPANALLPDRSGTGMVAPFHYQTVCTENLSPGWNESHYVLHGGKMDYFMKTTGSVPSTIDPEGTRAVGYYDHTDLPYYYELASQYATSDRWFAAMLGPTIPNRMYLFAGTSFGHIRPDAPPAGGWPQKTIFEHLSNHGISWRYYYQDSSVYLAEWKAWSTHSGKVYNISSYYNDIMNPSTLPQVIFIERASQLGLDEHPTKNVQKGSASIANIINAFIQSPAYADSVFILTFDEGGGLYDHVPPFSVPAPDNIAPMRKTGDLAGDFTKSGMRVPLIVVSPWVKRHFVSHVNRDFTSILALIEKRFNLPPLTARDAAADPMEEFFDFSAPQLATPPTLPVQPTNGTCNKNLQKAPGY